MTSAGFSFSQRAVVAMMLIMVLASCATYQPGSVSQSPGSYLLDVIKQEDIRQADEIRQVIARLSQDPVLQPEVRKALLQAPGPAARLLSALSVNTPLIEALAELSEAAPEDTLPLLYLALSLYPQEQYRLLDALLLDDRFDESAIGDAALMAQLDPVHIFEPSAARAEPIELVPLIRSASITLNDRSPDTHAELWYRQTDSPIWLPGLALTYDPIRGALSGSLVRLQADTAYAIRVNLSGPADMSEQLILYVRTRPDSPPVDADKIYHLRDVYSGGQLNLEQLGIAGKAGGWAKIIGDPDTPVEVDDSEDAALHIGNNSYILFENISVKGGRRFGVFSHKAHHLWFKGCNISDFGRISRQQRRGIGYENPGDKSPINYDAGIFLKQSGVVVIENCEIHSPRTAANNWGRGHPKGASALLLLARHPNADYSGQYIIRNNRFYGAPLHRFNDVIESRSNGRVWGGLVRDSAIYNNYLAYANDDVIEIDGGQRNVLVYDNEIEQGFVGISVTPNMLGPNYLFNNYIHNLGDDRGSAWAAFKLGGLMSAPAGISHIFENLVTSEKGAGVAASNFKGDDTFWADVRNNIIVLGSHWRARGQGIYDVQKYPDSYFSNNLMYNTRTGQAEFDANLSVEFYDDSLLDAAHSSQILDAQGYYRLVIPQHLAIPNFSRVSATGELIIGPNPAFDNDAQADAGEDRQTGQDKLPISQLNSTQ